MWVHVGACLSVGTAGQCTQLYFHQRKRWLDPGTQPSASSSLLRSLAGWPGWPIYTPSLAVCLLPETDRLAWAVIYFNIECTRIYFGCIIREVHYYLTCLDLTPHTGQVSEVIQKSLLLVFTAPLAQAYILWAFVF